MSGSRRVRLALLVCVPVWFVACVPADRACAQAAQAALEGEGAAADARTQARALFAEGLELVEREDWAQAEDRFRRVLELHSSHVAAYNLASALVHLGRLVEAAEVLRSITRAEDVDAQTREAAQQLLRETEPRIGSLTIRITGDMTAVQFTLDDKPLELTARVETISVDPGAHVVSARRGTAQLALRDAIVGGTDSLQVEMLLELPAPIATVAQLPHAVPSRHEPDARTLTGADLARAEQREGGGVPWWLWAAGGVAIAAAAAVTVAIAASGSEATPIAGTTDPPLVRGRVR